MILLHIFSSLDQRLDSLESRLRKQIEENKILLDKFKHLDNDLEQQPVHQVEHNNGVKVEIVRLEQEEKDKGEDEDLHQDQEDKEHDEPRLEVKEEPGENKSNYVIPILLFACNRYVTLKVVIVCFTRKLQILL